MTNKISIDETLNIVLNNKISKIKHHNKFTNLLLYISFILKYLYKLKSNIYDNSLNTILNDFCSAIDKYIFIYGYDDILSILNKSSHIKSYNYGNNNTIMNGHTINYKYRNLIMQDNADPISFFINIEFRDSMITITNSDYALKDFLVTLQVHDNIQHGDKFYDTHINFSSHNNPKEVDNYIRKNIELSIIPLIRLKIFGG